MPRPYQQPGLSMSADHSNDLSLVKALQADLRALGYLRQGIDGQFGQGTAGAIRALQYDLLFNAGASRGGDGAASAAMTGFNLAAPTGGGRSVVARTGVLDQPLAACIDALVSDAAVGKIPRSQNPTAENTKAVQAIKAITSTVAPTPFIAACVIQESGGQHFRVPAGANEDNFVVVGLDRGNPDQPDQITSRGYGIGQYTLFHHPPRAEEVRDFILDPVRNVAKAFHELRAKFDGFIAGPSDTADDRKAEHGPAPLRLCQYAPADPRYMTDCNACAKAVRTIDITEGMRPYAGASFGYEPDQYYPSVRYDHVPNRAEFLCDWPYAVRRYNGSGNDSFHYQTRILLNLLAG